MKYKNHSIRLNDYRHGSYPETTYEVINLNNCDESMSYFATVEQAMEYVDEKTEKQ